MERSIGDLFVYDNRMCVVVEDSQYDKSEACEGCAFSTAFCTKIFHIRGACTPDLRYDGRLVHFEYFDAGTAPQAKKGGE